MSTKYEICKLQFTYSAKSLPVLSLVFAAKLKFPIPIHIYICTERRYLHTSFQNKTALVPNDWTEGRFGRCLSFEPAEKRVECKITAPNPDSLMTIPSVAGDDQFLNKPPKASTALAHCGKSIDRAYGRGEPPFPIRHPNGGTVSEFDKRYKHTQICQC